MATRTDDAVTPDPASPTVALPAAIADLPTIFLVDDDPAVRDAVSLLLRASGLAVEAYPGPADFLAADAARRSGCLVLDVRIPDMSGLDVQKQHTGGWLRDTDHFHDQLRRCADGAPGDESRCAGLY
ncbi:MAG: response regulator transcription factor [Candidatus Competibacteraceae bacterium]